MFTTTPKSFLWTLICPIPTYARCRCWGFFNQLSTYIQYKTRAERSTFIFDVFSIFVFYAYQASNYKFKLIIHFHVSICRWPLNIKKLRRWNLTLSIVICQVMSIANEFQVLMSSSLCSLCFIPLHRHAFDFWNSNETTSTIIKAFTHSPTFFSREFPP